MFMWRSTNLHAFGCTVTFESPRTTRKIMYRTWDLKEYKTACTSMLNSVLFQKRYVNNASINLNNLLKSCKFFLGQEHGGIGVDSIFVFTQAWPRHIPCIPKISAMTDLPKNYQSKVYFL